MDWMYNGTKIQKEDYLLGRKVEKTFDEASANGMIINYINIINIVMIIIGILNSFFYRI